MLVSRPDMEYTYRNEAALIKDLKCLQNAIRENNRAMCVGLQEQYRPFLPDSLALSDDLSSKHREVDTLSLFLMPEDVPAEFYSPRKVSGDGNCLFNAISVCMVGNESLAIVLRLLTAAELYLQEDFYSNHPR